MYEAKTSVLNVIDANSSEYELQCFPREKMAFLKGLFRRQNQENLSQKTVQEQEAELLKVTGITLDDVPKYSEINYNIKYENEAKIGTK